MLIDLSDKKYHALKKEVLIQVEDSFIKAEYARMNEILKVSGEHALVHYVRSRHKHYCKNNSI